MALRDKPLSYDALMREIRGEDRKSAPLTFISGRLTPEQTERVRRPMPGNRIAFDDDALRRELSEAGLL